MGTQVEPVCLVLWSSTLRLWGERPVGSLEPGSSWRPRYQVVVPRDGRL